jgi:hypothetical protein
MSTLSKLVVLSFICSIGLFGCRDHLDEPQATSSNAIESDHPYCVWDRCRDSVSASSATCIQDSQCTGQVLGEFRAALDALWDAKQTAESAARSAEAAYLQRTFQSSSVTACWQHAQTVLSMSFSQTVQWCDQQVAADPQVQEARAAAAQALTAYSQENARYFQALQQRCQQLSQACGSEQTSACGARPADPPPDSCETETESGENGPDED